MNEVHFKEDPGCGLSPSANPCANCVTATPLPPSPRYSQRAVNGPAPCEGVIMRDAGEEKREKEKKKKNKSELLTGAILCALKCPFFVPKVIHNLVALLMYSERY